MITSKHIQTFHQTLHRYQTAKFPTERRIVSAEQWWRLRNTAEEQRAGCDIARDGGFRSSSGWLHNVIVSKHADAMEAYPTAVILPREENDRTQADMLSDILPCVLEQNRFEGTYSDAMWQKLKTGTGVYRVVWDPTRLRGLGDIAIERVDLLSLYWEPGIDDIQRSRYLFHVELCGREELMAQYPRLREHPPTAAVFSPQRLLRDDGCEPDLTDRVTVIEVYYRKQEGGREILHYCKYADGWEEPLYATENDPALAQTGLYDHGRYPFVFDPLFPIENSPCGYGFVDLCRSPQTELDLLKTGFIKNAMVGATPRYFVRGEGVNEEEFLDLSRPLVHVPSAGEDALRRIEHSALDSVYIDLYDRTVAELRETSGNTETGTGNISAGVTAASAIVALQEASGKGSRDSTLASYRAFSDIVWLCIELIRQFYTLPRRFRIVGKDGAEAFLRFTNEGLVAQDGGLRLPIFDIRVAAQRRNAYSRVSQNELAMELFRLGLFDPARADQAMICLSMMDFEGKDEVMQAISAGLPPALSLEGEGAEDAAAGDAPSAEGGAHHADGTAAGVRPAARSADRGNAGARTAARKPPAPKLGGENTDPPHITAAREQSLRAPMP